MDEEKYFSKAFIICLAITTISIFSTLLYGSSQGNLVTMEQANATKTEIEQLASTITWDLIFINNLQIVLITIVPVLGLGWMVYVQYSTGYVIGELAKAYSINHVLLTVLLISDVVGLVEYIAYIFAMAESMIIVYSIYTREIKERLMKHTWKTLLLVFGLLFLGSLLEAWMLGRL